MSEESERNARHKQQMARRKAVVDAGIARATEQRGIVVVNTGKLLTIADSNDHMTQSVYGIWDRKLLSTRRGHESTLSSTPPTITRSNLQTQSIINPQLVPYQSTASDGTVVTLTRMVYGLTANTVYWTGGTVNGTVIAPQSGWALDLTFAESASSDATVDLPKAIYDPTPLADGALTLINSVVPATGQETCSGSSDGKGYTLVIDPTPAA
jgi:Tfp pilus tip-associated adhesin PilY1